MDRRMGRELVRAMHGQAGPVSVLTFAVVDPSRPFGPPHVRLPLQEEAFRTAGLPNRARS